MKYLHLFILGCFLIVSCSTKKGIDPINITGNQISDAYVKAIGGEKRLRKVKTMRMLIVSEIEGGEFEIESFTKAPDKLLQMNPEIDEKMFEIE